MKYLAFARGVVLVEKEKTIHRHTPASVRSSYSPPFEQFLNESKRQRRTSLPSGNHLIASLFSFLIECDAPS
jgi:hypothetical protein